MSGAWGTGGYDDLGPFGRPPSNSSTPVPRAGVLLWLTIVTVLGLAIAGFYLMSNAFGAGAAGSCGGG